MIVRPATREDIEAFSTRPNKPSIKACVGVLDGKIVALAGVAFSKGRWFAFCDLLPEARPFKFTLARNAIRGMEELKKQGVRFIFAAADPNEPGSERWLESLGFRIDPKTQLYRWSA